MNIYERDVKMFKPIIKEALYWKQYTYAMAVGFWLSYQGGVNNLNELKDSNKESFSKYMNTVVSVMLFSHDMYKTLDKQIRDYPDFISYINSGKHKIFNNQSPSLADVFNQYANIYDGYINDYMTRIDDAINKAKNNPSSITNAVENLESSVTLLSLKVTKDMFNQMARDFDQLNEKGQHDLFQFVRKDLVKHGIIPSDYKPRLHQ